MKFKKNDLLSLDKFIEKSLYNNKFGYYMKNNPFGEKGDFITAPNISILFSEMIAIWVISFWENLNCPKEFNLIELGAGNGAMMNIMVNTFARFPKFKSFQVARTNSKKIEIYVNIIKQISNLSTLLQIIR